MFCDRCQDILNLDILLSTLPKDRRRPQHKNLANLEASAEAGCTICSLVCADPVSRYIPTGLQSGQIYFRLHPNGLLVFQFDSLHETGHSLSRNSKILAIIRLSTNEGDPITNLQPGIFTSRPVADDSSSEACFKVTQYWLKTCLETHGSLCQVVDKLPLPTRVLDVGLQESTHVTLYIPNGQHGQWFTLSHCWGRSHPVTTTISNLESQCTGIMISTLPKTFRDAIYITRRLGYRFLWIDSLCIVQNSVIDWQEESVKMNTIYSNAVLNISADAAANSSEGIFDSSTNTTAQRGPGYMLPTSKPSLVQIPVHSPKTGLKYTLYIWYNKEFAYNQPLQERGWVLAEAVLSHRRLRYTSSGLSWSCTRVPTRCNETRPHEIHNLDERTFSIDSVYQILYKADVCEMDNDEKHFEIIRFWYLQVVDYTNRQLTFAHDQFPAFSGIAKMFCDLTQWQYKAGILVEDFRRGLLWQSCGRDMHLEVAPSWSWAALRHGEKNADIYDCVYDNMESIDDPQEVQLIDISVTNVGDNPFGQVMSGSLTLQGFCHPLYDLLKMNDFYFHWGWYEAFASTRDQNYQTFSEHRPPPLKALRLHMDIMDEAKILFWHSEDILILRIGMFPPDTESFARPIVEAAWFLIVQEIPTLKGSYRRIGTASIRGKGIESPDWKMKTVTIL
ncbi:HET-domain-containing protein [Hyaloscypha hepaticicola]|uniref:HET-domain-containing protein n=1 Tax=Hyaloscypha hepaticicola TaxID=2082293 RepID=A0A2J6PS03_9HELO|nr:HET-domain-containing protein [Hyaloscypha hepaticicola]